jgi:predicted 2-oxoglutarate/Fe(II)-dependent dioxygenase YbiX
MEKQQLIGDTAFVLRGFLSPEECALFIDRAEAIGFEEAPITTRGGFEMRKDIRDNSRVILDDPELAAFWWERARPSLVEEWFGWRLAGFNERFRFYRYDPGQRFAPHTDGYFQRESGQRSHFTFMAYLNADFSGGTTNLYKGCETLRVQPEPGLALVFAHKLLHEGAPVLSGRKYVLRTDVMYDRERA